MRAAVIQNGVVVNVIEVDSLDVFPGLVDGTDGEIGHLWDGTSFSVPTPSAPSRDELKMQRQAAVDAITVTVGVNVFNGDEISQDRMARALKVADITGQTSCTWVLADNTAATVTKEDLAQALALAMQAQAAIWVLPA